MTCSHLPTVLCQLKLSPGKQSLSATACTQDHPTSLPALPTPDSSKAGLQSPDTRWNWFVKFLSCEAAVPSSRRAGRVWDSPGTSLGQPRHLPLREHTSPPFAIGVETRHICSPIKSKSSSFPFILQSTNGNGVKTDQFNTLTLEKNILT